MGVQTSEVGFTPAMPRREDHEVHKGHVVALGGGNENFMKEQRLVSRAFMCVCVYFLHFA